jgi:hypothetical protein
MEFEPIIDKCEGCSRIQGEPGLLPEMPEIRTCLASMFPAAKWKNGNCNLATHIKKEEKKKVFVDPIKASKMMMKGKK